MFLKLMGITFVMQMIALAILGISLYFRRDKNRKIYACNATQDSNSDYICGCGTGYCQNLD